MDRRLVGQAEFPVTTAVTFNPAGMTCGANPGSAVTPDCTSPFRFTGVLHPVREPLAPMVRPSPLDDVRVRAVTDALRPYAWRGLTDEMICRRALAAVDGGGEGKTAGIPVPRHDEWIPVLLDSLHGRPWRALTVDALSRQLVTALDAWRHDSQWLEVELRWLFGADG